MSDNDFAHEPGEPDAAGASYPPLSRQSAVLFAWFVPPGQEELGEYYVTLLQTHFADAMLFVGMNHGSDPVWEARFGDTGLHAEVHWARPEIGDYWDATGFLTALEAFHHSGDAFELAWFGHTKGGSRPFADYVHIRWEEEREFWARREEIAQVFADSDIGLFAPRFNLTPPYPFPGPWRGWTDELAALNRIYRGPFAPLGLCALDTFFVLRGEIVRRFCTAVGDTWFRTDPGAYGANKWFFEMAFPSIASMQGYVPFIDQAVPGDGQPRDDQMISRDVRQVHRLAAAELERWRGDPIEFTPRIIPWDRPAWSARTAASDDGADHDADRGIDLAAREPATVSHRLESKGWLRAPETGAWEPIAGAAHDGLHIVLDEPIAAPFRARLVLTASGMTTLRLSLWGPGGQWVRNAWLDVERPGALQHELRRVGLYTNPTLRHFEIELEDIVAPGEELSTLTLFPAGIDLRDVAPGPAMAIQLHEARIVRDWPVGPPVRHVPDWTDGSKFPARRANGTRDAVVFAWFVPERMPELGEYYLNVLRYYHADSRLFIGINPGSDAVWEERLRDSGLDADVRWARADIGDYWDATGFLTALEAYSESEDRFGLVWFGHTKGGSRGDFAEYAGTRYALLRNFWGRRREIERIFTDPRIGIFAPRFSPLPAGFYGDELPALQRIYQDRFAPLGLHAKETFYVLRESIPRRFCQTAGPQFFRTPPGAYGAGRYFFEIGLPNIATMQGYEPFIDADVPGENHPRDDAWLRHDPKQNHRLARAELERWRADPYQFVARRIPEALGDVLDPALTAANVPGPQSPAMLAQVSPLPDEELSRRLGSERESAIPLIVSLGGGHWIDDHEVWRPQSDNDGSPLELVLSQPILYGQQGTAELQVSGMEVLRLRFLYEGPSEPIHRDVHLDITHPGAAHHQLDSLRLAVNQPLGTLELDWEDALADGTQFKSISLTPTDHELNPVHLKPSMSIKILSLEIREGPRAGTRIPFAVSRLPGRELPSKRSHGKRDAVVFSWWLPEHGEADKVGEYFIGLLSYHHPDSKIFVGMHHGSNPLWEDRLRGAGLDATVRWARPGLEDLWDVTGFQTALEALSDRDEEFDLVWFGHTKGASSASYDAYTRYRYQHDRRFWSRRCDVERFFSDPRVGLFSHRYGLFDTSSAPSWSGTAELEALQRIYRGQFSPIGLWAWETVFVLRYVIVRGFLKSVGQPFFETSPAAYGANRWWFEAAFPSIASIQGFEPYIELDTDGPGDPREDIALYRDPRQGNRLALQELERWREHPYLFQPRGLPKG